MRHLRLEARGAAEHAGRPEKLPAVEWQELGGLRAKKMGQGNVGGPAVRSRFDKSAGERHNSTPKK